MITHELPPPFRPELAERYRAAGLWGSRSIAREFTAVAQQHPSAVALVTDQGSLTYAELDTSTDRIGAGLLELGLEPGDRVIFQVTNRLETVVAWYACLKAALVPVATLAAHRAHEIAEISRQCSATAHLVEAGLSFDLVAFARDIALRGVIVQRGGGRATARLGSRDEGRPLDPGHPQRGHHLRGPRRAQLWSHARPRHSRCRCLPGSAVPGRHRHRADRARPLRRLQPASLPRPAPHPAAGCPVRDQ